MAKKAIILGSGLDVFQDLKPSESISYKELHERDPSWPLSSVKGHKGILEKYKKNSDEIWVLRGRAHLYEGFSWEDVSYPTKFLIKNGISEMILTNAAGGINPKFEIGDLMQITGYFNFLKPDRVRGNLGALLEKPVMLAGMSDFGENENSGDTARVHKGIYIGVHGPNYETNAEINLFRNLGADAVGMSTIPELEAIREHNENLGSSGSFVKVIAVSVITNVYGKTLDLGHDGVLAVAKRSSERLFSIIV